MYRDGRSVAKDEARAMQLYQATRARADALGNMYADGHGVAEQAPAVKLWPAAAARATPRTMQPRRHVHGRGVAKNGPRGETLAGGSGQGGARASATSATCARAGAAPPRTRRARRRSPRGSSRCAASTAPFLNFGTPYRFDAAPNAVHAWDAGFDVRAYATHGVMHGVYHYMLRGPVPPP